jgi:glycosyltransferase involved in cell wall biosynthesis/GT2 family glycosyltransferase
VVGGQETWLLRLLDATDRLDVTAVLLADGALRGELERRGIGVTVIAAGTRPHEMAAPVARLTRDLLRDPPDVVLATGVKAQVVAGPAARLAGVPLVWAKHDHSFDGPLTRVLAMLADAVVGTVAEVLEAVPADGAVVLEPPRDDVVPAARAAARRRLQSLGVQLDGAPTMVMATRLVAYKGVDDAITALSRPGGEEWRLVVAGPADETEPGERHRLEQLAEHLGVADRVQLTGPLPELPRWLSAFDALAVLTKPAGPRTPGREGFGMSAFEAMRAGIPVVAVTGGAVIRRLAGSAGLGVPPGDPSAVAAALGRLRDPVLRRRMGRAGRELVVDHPDAARQADRLAALLGAVAARPGAGRTVGDPVSVVVPVFREGALVDDLVAALLAQLGADDEVVVVDDGSPDDTAARVRRLAAEHAQVTAVVLPANAGAAAARNAGIAAARHELIACTDAGNDPDDGWLAAMRAALSDVPQPQLVTGAYRVTATTPVEQAMAAALYPDVAEARRPTLLVRVYTRLLGRAFDASRPAGRSMAFPRAAWRRVGGFPEDLRAGEDVAFGRAVAADSGPCVLQTEAAVTWQHHATLAGTARMYRRYGAGDAASGDRAMVARNLLRAGAIAAAPLLLARGRTSRRLVVAGAAAYASLPVVRLRRQRAALPAFALLPVVLAVKDVAKAVGCVEGLLRR